MRLAVLSDAHLIAPSDPHQSLHEKRSHFVGAWRSFRRMLELVVEEQPDLMVFLGDLVDYYSDENRDFAIELIEEQGIAWELVPGNHDLSWWQDKTREGPVRDSEQGSRKARAGWKERGIDLSNRFFEHGDIGFILLDSARSGVSEGTADWLQPILAKNAVNLIFTHVPPDLPAVRDYIQGVDPGRDLDKYVQSRSPGFFAPYLGSIRCFFCGHEHFRGRVDLEESQVCILPVSVKAGREYPEMGQALLLDTEGMDEKVVAMKSVNSSLEQDTAN